MKKRILSICLTLAWMLTLIPAAVPGVQAVGDAEYGWAQMQDSIAVRYLVDGTESSRVAVGDIFQVELWINGIDPYAMNIPLSWDPSIVTMVNEETGTPVTSGRKQEADVGDGFRPGASCYDSSYGGDFLPLYWNGKPVYTEADDTNEGYPYIDNQNGHCRFLYYVDAATPSAGPQLFLELSFKALKAGNANFHFATSAETNYDPAAENGLTLAYTNGGVQNLELEISALNVIENWDDESTVPGGVDNSNASADTPEPAPTPEPEPTPAPEETLPETDMKDAAHLDCYPYQTPTYAQTVVRTSGGQTAQKADNYILPASTLAEAINQAIAAGSTAIVAKMPDRLIDKDNYTVSFSCENLDDLTNRSNAMLYLETPWGYVGVDPAALLAEVEDSAQVTLSAAPAENGIRLSVRIDGKTQTGFESPLFRLILPYAGAAEPVVYSSTVFGMRYQSRGQQPLPISRYDKDHGAVIFVTPSAGTYTIGNAEAKEFSDVPDSHWAAEAIGELSAAGIVNGQSATEYVPDAKVTRAEMAKLMTCVLGTYQTQMNIKFQDVENADWFYPYVGSAYAVGIVKGQSETVFAPESNITRQDAAVMAYRGLALLGLVPEPVRQAPQFRDQDQIADYAKEAVTALYRAGLINGLPDGTFNPRGTSSRAVAAQIISGVYRQLQGLV